MKNSLAVKFLERALDRITENEDKIKFLAEEADLIFDSGFNYLPVFYCFEYKLSDRQDIDGTRYVVAKAVFDSDGDLKDVECFSGIEYALRFAFNSCDIDASDLYIHDLELYFNYAKFWSLETVINDELSPNYEIVEEEEVSQNNDDLIYIVKDGDVYKVVDYDDYCMSDFKEAVLKEKL